MNGDLMNKTSHSQRGFRGCYFDRAVEYCSKLAAIVVPSLDLVNRKLIASPAKLGVAVALGAVVAHTCVDERHFGQRLVHLIGWLTGQRYHVLRDALLKGAKRAAIAERELAWHQRLPDVGKWRAERDYCIQRCEGLLAYAVEQTVVSERAALRLAGCVYEVVACERRWVNGKAYAGDPDGHWQRMESLAGRIAQEWATDKWWRASRCLVFRFRYPQLG